MKGAIRRALPLPGRLVQFVLFSVSSTRLVLSRGEAGRIIEAFGRVVVQGNAVRGRGGVRDPHPRAAAGGREGGRAGGRGRRRGSRSTRCPGSRWPSTPTLRAGAVGRDRGAAAAARPRARGAALRRDGRRAQVREGGRGGRRRHRAREPRGGLVAGALRGMDVAAAARRYALLAIGDGLVSAGPRPPPRGRGGGGGDAGRGGGGG